MTKPKTKVEGRQPPEDKKMTAVIFDYRYFMCSVRARGVDVFIGRRYTTTGLARYIVRYRLVTNSTREGRLIFLSVLGKMLDCHCSLGCLMLSQE